MALRPITSFYGVIVIRRPVGAVGIPDDAAIGQTKPLIPARVVGLQELGGLGNTDELVWYTWKLSDALPL